MKTIVFILLLSLAFWGNGFAQFTEKSMYPSSIIQIEPTGMVHPLDSSFIFFSSVTTNTSTGFRSEGVYISRDGGNTFSGTDTCRGEFILNHGGDPGTVVTPAGKLVLTHLGNVFQGLYAHTSTDNGITWSNSVTITSQTPEDKGTTILDASPASPFFGRIYTFWVDLNQTPFAVNFSFSTNEGISWSSPRTINPNPPKRSSGAAAAIAKDGTVYVTWAGIASTSPFNGEQVGLAVSSDGGANWSVNQSAFTCKTLSGVLASKSNIRVNGLPRIEIDKSNGTRSGYMYIVTTEAGSSGAGADPDIILRYSSNRGVVWSSPMRINKDLFNNGKIQYFPAITVDNSGGVNILFYDDRATTSDSTGVMLARASDNLSDWTEYQVSQKNFQPKPIIGTASGYQGDYIALLTLPQSLLAAWMSNTTGRYQIRYSKIPLGSVIVEDTRSKEDRQKGFSVFPTIVSRGGSITLSSSEEITDYSMYNITGQISTTGTGLTLGSNNSTQIRIPNISSGVYFLIPHTKNGNLKPIKLIVY